MSRIMVYVKAFVRSLPLSAKIIIPLMIAFVLLLVVSSILDSAQVEKAQKQEAERHAQVRAASEKSRAEAERRFNSMTPREHLAAAQNAWHYGSEAGDVELAIRHLKAIPNTAVDAKLAASMLAAAEVEEKRRVFQRNYEEYLKRQEEQVRLEQERARRVAEEQTRQQRKRDADAEVYSYIPKVLRVDTDMDSFWLPDEERICATYPNDKGRVVSVMCTSSTTHGQHNIPVEFWGGVDRNIVSNWKCRREKSLLSDRFVCRAID